MGIWKYKEVTGYWVYVIKTPDNMYYVGFSGQKKCSDRWKPSHYNRKISLKKYIEKFEWDDFQKMVITDGLTKEQALYWEDKLICMYRMLGCCINDVRSGWISRDKTQYRNVGMIHTKSKEKCVIKNTVINIKILLNSRYITEYKPTITITLPKL